MKKTVILTSLIIILGVSFLQSCKRKGCTNPRATNYDPKAKEDDGTCIIPGCTNPKAENYDPTATQDNGTCKICGCTDPTAINYEATANKDDGSCTYYGRNVFWISSNLNCGYISVYVGGSYIGQITSYYYSGAPDCGAYGCATVKKAAGTYNFTAQSQYYGYSWEGTITIVSNGCSKMRLYIGKNNKTLATDVNQENTTDIKFEAITNK